MATDEYERLAWSQGKDLIGFDESGMGCLAGHLVVAGVIFPTGFDFKALPGLNDSKKLTEEQRYRLEPIIKASAKYWFCEEASAPEVDACKVDKFNVYWLRFQMLEKHVENNRALLPENLVAYMDGNKALKLNGIESRCLVKGDAKVYSIAAASVLAKCRKDRLMDGSDQQYPGYGFAVNKGYWSAEHEQKVIDSGPTPLHRLSYLRNITWNGK